MIFQLITNMQGIPSQKNMKWYVFLVFFRFFYNKNFKPTRLQCKTYHYKSIDCCLQAICLVIIAYIIPSIGFGNPKNLVQLQNNYYCRFLLSCWCSSRLNLYRKLFVNYQLFSLLFILRIYDKNCLISFVFINFYKSRSYFFSILSFLKLNSIIHLLWPITKSIIVSI
jgi:hypothetical protein